MDTKFKYIGDTLPNNQLVKGHTYYGHIELVEIHNGTKSPALKITIDNRPLYMFQYHRDFVSLSI